MSGIRWTSKRIAVLLAILLFSGYRLGGTANYSPLIERYPRQTGALDSVPVQHTLSQGETERVTLNLSLNGINYTFSSVGIEIVYSDSENYAHLFQNESFMQKVASFNDMISYLAYTSDNDIAIRNMSSYDMHKVQSFVFFNQTLFVQLIAHSLAQTESDSVLGYRVHEMRTITISAVNSSEIVSHIAVMEATLNEAPRHGINISITEMPLLPMLQGKLYSYGNLSWYAGLNEGEITYQSDSFNGSLLYDLHWGVHIEHTFIGYGICYTYISAYPCNLHFTLNGHLLAIYAGSAYPVIMTPWLPWCIAALGMGVFIAAAMVIHFVQKRKNH